jgi:hypothetical protein
MPWSGVFSPHDARLGAASALWNENILEIPHTAGKSAKHEISGICSCIAQRLCGRPSKVSSGMVDNFHHNAPVVNVPAEALSLCPISTSMRLIQPK